MVGVRVVVGGGAGSSGTDKGRKGTHNLGRTRGHEGRERGEDGGGKAHGEGARAPAPATRIAPARDEGARCALPRRTARERERARERGGELGRVRAGGPRLPSRADSEGRIMTPATRRASRTGSSASARAADGPAAPDLHPAGVRGCETRRARGDQSLYTIPSGKTEDGIRGGGGGG